MHHASLFPTIALQVEKMGSLQKFPHKDWKLSTINIEGGEKKEYDEKLHADKIHLNNIQRFHAKCDFICMSLIDPCQDMTCKA